MAGSEHVYSYAEIPLLGCEVGYNGNSVHDASDNSDEENVPDRLSIQRAVELGMTRRVRASLEKDPDSEARFDGGIHAVSSELRAQPSPHDGSPRVAHSRLHFKGRKDMHSTPVRSSHFQRRDRHSLDLGADTSWMEFSHHKAREQGLLTKKHPYQDAWRQYSSGREVGPRSFQGGHRTDLRHLPKAARPHWQGNNLSRSFPDRRERASPSVYRSSPVEGRRSHHMDRQVCASSLGKGLLPHPPTEYGYGSSSSRGPLLNMALKGRWDPGDGYQDCQIEGYPRGGLQASSSRCKSVKDKQHGKNANWGAFQGHSWSSSGSLGPTQPKKPRLQEEASENMSPSNNISENSQISCNSESLRSKIQNVGKNSDCVMQKAFSDISQYSDHRQDGVLYGEGEGWSRENNDGNAVVSSSNSLGAEKDGAHWDRYSDITAVSEDQQVGKPCVGTPHFSDISSDSSDGVQEKREYVGEEPSCCPVYSSRSSPQKHDYSNVTSVSPGRVSHVSSGVVIVKVPCDGITLSSDGHSRSGNKAAGGKSHSDVVSVRSGEPMGIQYVEGEQSHFSDISSYASDNATDQAGLGKEIELSSLMGSEFRQRHMTDEAMSGASSRQTVEAYQSAPEGQALTECEDRLGDHGEAGGEQNRESRPQAACNMTGELEGETQMNESTSCSVQDTLDVKEQQVMSDFEDNQSNTASVMSCVLNADEDQLEQACSTGTTVFPDTPSCTGEDGDSSSSSDIVVATFSAGEPEDVSMDIANVPEMDAENCSPTEQPSLSQDRQSDCDRQCYTDADITIVSEVLGPSCHPRVPNSGLRQEVDGDRNLFTSLFKLKRCSKCKQEKCSWDCCSVQSALKPASEATQDDARAVEFPCPNSGDAARKTNMSPSTDLSNTSDQALLSKGVTSFPSGKAENKMVDIKVVTDRLLHFFKSPKNHARVPSKSAAQPPSGSLPAGASTLKRSFSCPARETEKGKTASAQSASMAPQKDGREGIFAIDWNSKLLLDKTWYAPPSPSTPDAKPTSSQSAAQATKTKMPNSSKKHQSSRQKLEKLSLRKSRTEKARSAKPRIQPYEEDAALSNLFMQLQICKVRGSQRARTRQECRPLQDSLACMVQYGLENGGEHIADSLELLEEFSQKFRPSRHLLWKIITTGILDSTRRKTMLSVEAVVRKMWERHPTSVFVDWEEVLFALKPSSSYPVLNQSILIHTVISGLEIELATHNISSMHSIQRSLVYRFLGTESYTSYLKTLYSHVTYWLANCQQLLQATQHSQSAVLVPPRSGGNSARQEAEKVELTRRQMLLPGLFQLLELGVNVSQSCTKTAGRLAQEVVNNYIYLPDLERKRQLLELLSSPLLTFKVVQQILEKFCANTIKCCVEFPAHPVDVAEAFSASLPPCIPTTPPQSPLEPMEVEQEQQPAARFSAACVEELTMLAFYATRSYLTTIRGRLHMPLHLRCRSEGSPSPGPNCRGAVQRFREHIQSLHPEPTASTLNYLNSLEQLLLR